MKKLICNFSILIFLITSCQPDVNSDKIEQWKSEIRAAEQAFNDMAQKEGLDKAFEYYAAEDGVIRRNKKIIKGKSAIAKWYKNDFRPNQTLTWEPTFVDVSISGDMAFTYGDYIFTSVDSSGIKKESTGIFHTVWKRQADQSWKFAWD